MSPVDTALGRRRRLGAVLRRRLWGRALGLWAVEALLIVALPVFVLLVAPSRGGPVIASMFVFTRVVVCVVQIGIWHSRRGAMSDAADDGPSLTPR